ncbi:hypothetical protein [Stackebrandtia soli]|uniref:hypothetical protein n=1 Tax=Stackebrandtia soli TaxID=1892856 RepID=UPI0039E90658
MATEISVDDLSQMWRVGAVDLPTAANQFAAAATAIHATAGSADGAFTGPASGTSPMAGPWATLRNTLQDRIFVKTNENLNKAGDVLAAMAIAFSEQDASNKTGLETAIEGIETGPDYERPPTEQHAPSSDEPQ